MRSSNDRKPQALFEFETENIDEEKHLQGFSTEEKKMIKLMSSIVVKNLIKSVNSKNEEEKLTKRNLF